MSADAMARLREMLYPTKPRIFIGLGPPPEPTISADDLRALLDRAALLDEALAALEASPDTGRHAVDVTESPCQCSRCRFVDRRSAVLAKAGRR